MRIIHNYTCIVMYNTEVSEIKVHLLCTPAYKELVLPVYYSFANRLLVQSI